jgi:photosystem II stability/assembly factor-like uncharacterized protein
MSPKSNVAVRTPHGRSEAHRITSPGVAMDPELGALVVVPPGVTRSP